MESNEYLNFAKEMCIEAGKIMKKYFYQDNGASYKGDKTIVTFVIIDNTNPTIEPTTDSVGSEGYYSKIGLTFEDNFGIASYEINGETLIITNGEISSDDLVKYLEEGENTVVASDNAGNTATFTFIYDSKAPVADFVRIQNLTQPNNQKYAKVGDKIWLYVKIPNSELSSEPKITINGKEARVFVNEDRFGYKKYVGEIIMTEDMPEGQIQFNVYGYKDLAGNVGATLTSTTDASSIIFDKTAPGFVSNPWKIYVEANKGTEFPKELYPQVSGSDNFSGEVTPELVNVYVNMARPSTSDTEYKLQYVTRDEAGNEAYNDVFVIVQDTTVPTIKVDGKDETIEAGSQKVYDIPEATVEDNADITHDYKVRIVYYPDYENDGHHETVSAVDTRKPGVYGIIYSYTDDANNTAREVVIKVTVKDTIKPVITVNGETEVTIKAGSQKVFDVPEAIVTDNAYVTHDYKVRIVYYQDYDNSGIHTDVPAVDTSKVGTYKIIYSYTDDSNNTAREFAVTVNVIE